MEHTTVTGGLVVVAVTGDIMRNTLQRRKHLIYKLPMAEYRNTSISVIVNTPGGRDPTTPSTQQIYGHLTDTWVANTHQHEVLCEPICNNS